MGSLNDNQEALEQKLEKGVSGEKGALTPKEIVKELDRYIIGQDNAKRSVAIALRNRWRRQQVPEELRDEIAPKNIIMIGPTGVGKTEIARRLAKLAQAPFIKVEASKFTEVGYVGRDVESMVRDLMEISVKMCREEEQRIVKKKAEEIAEERILDLLLPPGVQEAREEEEVMGSNLEVTDSSSTREKFRKLFKKGKLDDRMVEVEVTQKTSSVAHVFTPSGTEEIDLNLSEMLGNLFPKKTKNKKVKIPEAYEILVQEEAAKLIDMDAVVNKALKRAENTGIIFVDELDKIASRETGAGPDISREGVQRDILPIVEGCSVATKYGMVNTDHVLFIAAGAFHMSKPSDLIPELQGRFPIRVELAGLNKDDFIKILTAPENALTKQYQALMKTEEIDLSFKEDAIVEICGIAAQINESMENIGARRLHTIMEKVLEDISFNAPERKGDKIEIDASYVIEKLKDIVKDQDLSRYIL